MALIAVGSTNPGKFEAAHFLREYDPSFLFQQASVSSGVPDQPWNDADTRAGAIQRLDAFEYPRYRTITGTVELEF